MATPINQSTMLGSGSSLSLNGSTFKVGLQSSTSSLKSASSLSGQSGFSLSNGTLTVSKAGAVLDGYDLRNVAVVVKADNVTVKNSLFNATGFHTIYQTGSYSGLTVQHNTFDGQKANNSNSDIIYSNGGKMNVSYNEFFNLPSDAINSQGGSIDHNYFSGAGYQTGAHADAISVHGTKSPLSINNNYIDYRTPGDARVPDTNAAIKLTSHFGNISNVTVDSNVLLGGGYTVYVNKDAYSISGVKITNNDIGMAHWGQLYPNGKPSDLVFSGNHDFVKDAHLLTGGPAPAPTPTPTPSPTPAPTPTPTPPTGTMVGTDKQDIMRGSEGADVIYGKGGIDVITAGGGNDTIIGGAHKDWLSGQGGNDAFVFTSVNDSLPGAANRDVITHFGLGGTSPSGKDTIDLHLIDANTMAAGDQAFTFVGTNAFSGKAGELHTYFNGQNTIVEGTVNADKVADFQIEIQGKVTLSMHDFIL